MRALRVKQELLAQRAPSHRMSAGVTRVLRSFSSVRSAPFGSLRAANRDSSHVALVGRGEEKPDARRERIGR
jgi:hypothetical protein